jgi:hypothetical protein
MMTRMLPVLGVMHYEFKWARDAYVHFETPWFAVRFASRIYEPTASPRL